MDSTTSVLIVGAGPTGLMLAAQLALRGIAFRIIDKNADHTTQSRAIVVHARSLEIFDQMGLVEEAMTKGRLVSEVEAWFNGKPKVRMRAGRFLSRELTKFPFVLILPQYETEGILTGFLERRAHKVERAIELIELQQDENGATAILQHGDGRKETVGCQYVIGADGAHSAVRTLLNVPFEGTTYAVSLFVLDCDVQGNLPQDGIRLYITGDALTGFFPLPDGRHRIIGTVPKNKEGQELTFDDIAREFSHRVAGAISISNPHWLSVYHTHHRYAAHFKIGRCFLAGDAAHIHSPVGGQGMNTGLQDAYNLAWKLALAAQGKARDGLLDSYEAERVQIAKDLVHSTDRIFYFAINQHPIGKFLRMHVLPFVLTLLQPFMEQNWWRQGFFSRIAELGISYRQSPLSQLASIGEFPKTALMPGDRAPALLQPRLRDTAFHLVIFGQEPFLNARIIAERYGMVCNAISTSDAELNQAFGISGPAYYLIRPDMHIAYRSTIDDTAQLEGYLQRWMK